MARQIVVDIVGDATKFNAATSGAIKKAGGLKGALSGIGTGMKLGIGIGAVDLFRDAISGVGQALGEAKDALMLQGALLAQTEAGIKSTGGAAGVTAEHILDFSQALEDTTGIEQEAIQTGQNMLLTFTNIRNEVGKGNDVFDQATDAIADMATKMNGGLAPSAEQLQTTAIQLGKALNDPIAGLTSLGKVGVKFTAEQKKLIKGMVESGDTMGAQKVILAELQAEFGGAAEAFGKTDAGKVAQGNNKMGEAFERLMVPMEKIMVAVLPVLADAMIFVVGALEQVYSAIAPVVQTLAKELTPAFQVVGTVASVAFGVIGKAIEVAVGIMQASFRVIGGIVGTAVNMFQGLARVVGFVFSTIATVIKTAINGVINIVNGIIRGINAIQVHIDVGPVKLDWNGLNLGLIKKMHAGGIVSGAPGSDQLRMLQAGERVLPRGQAGGLVVNIHIDQGAYIDGPGIDMLTNRIAARLRYATGR